MIKASGTEQMFFDSSGVFELNDDAAKPVKYTIRELDYQNITKLFIR